MAYGPAPYGQPMPQPMPMYPVQKQSSGKLMAAGVLNLIGFIEALAFVALAFVGGLFTFLLSWICIPVFLVGAIFALLGMIFCFKRTNYGLCLVSSILAMLFGGGIWSLIALILVAISKEDFIDQPQAAMAPVVMAQPMQPMYQQPMMQQPMPQQPPAAAAGAGQWKFCSNCGNQVAANAMNCPKCGAKIA